MFKLISLNHITASFHKSYRHYKVVLSLSLEKLGKLCKFLEVT